MKLILAIISKDDMDAVLSEMVRSRLMAAHIATTRGFLEPGAATLVIKAQDDQVRLALDILKEKAGTHNRTSPSDYSTPTISEEGGGAVFVLDVEQYVNL